MFANRKYHFSFMELSVIHQEIKGQKFDHSTTLRVKHDISEVQYSLIDILH